MNINRKQFTVGFLAITIVAIALYIILESPLFLRSRVAGIKIGSGWTDYFYLTSNQFACTTDGNAAHTDCALSLEGNPLEISVSYTPGDSLLGCTATYADKPVPCRPSHSIFNTTKLGVYIDDDLSISPMRMAQIRSRTSPALPVRGNLAHADKWAGSCRHHPDTGRFLDTSPTKTISTYPHQSSEVGRHPGSQRPHLVRLIMGFNHPGICGLARLQ